MRYRWIHSEEVDGITVIRFTHRGMLQGESAELIGEQLFSLVEDQGRRRLLLNLDQVDGLESAMLARFIALHKKVLAAGGQLKFCQLAPQVYDAFEAVGFPQLLGIYPGEQDALKTF